MRKDTADSASARSSDLPDFARLRTRWRGFSRLEKIIAAAVLMGLGGAVAWFVLSGQPTAWHNWDFRNNLWGPSFLLLNGQSPYQIELLFADSNAVWLPMSIGVFFPLGWLTLAQAGNLWFIINFALLVGMFGLIWQGQRLTPVLLGLGIILVFLFPPVISHISLGQFTIVTVFLLLLVAFRAEEYPHWWVGLLLALALCKPQLVILVLPGLALKYYRTGGISRVLIFGGTLLLGLLLLTVPLWLGYPNWLAGFIAALTRNEVWAHPSLYTLLRLKLGTPGFLLWGVVAAVVFGVNLWLWDTRPAREVVIWSLALTLLITPYVWSWDFVMLVPLLLYALRYLSSRLALLWFLLGYGLCWVLILRVYSSPNYTDMSFWWVPWFLVAVVASAKGIQARWSKR